MKGRSVQEFTFRTLRIASLTLTYTVLLLAYGGFVWVRDTGRYRFAQITYKYNKEPQNNRPYKYLVHVLSHSSKGGGGVPSSRSTKNRSQSCYDGRQLRELILNQKTAVKHVSFNVSFCARGPSCVGRVFYICSTHSLPHTFVEIGMFGPNLSTSARVNSEENFSDKLAIVHCIRGWCP